MNKRTLIHELMLMAIDFNGFEPAEKELTGEKPTIIFDFYGNTGMINLMIFENGWEPDAFPDVNLYLHTDQSHYNEIEYIKAIGMLKRLKEKTNNELR